jgi:very-short-patch-repair endonuclease
MSIWDNIFDSLKVETDLAMAKLVDTDTFKAMGSDIERAYACMAVMSFRIALIKPSLHIGMPQQAAGDDWVFFLAPQYQIGPYRVDFVFGSSDDISPAASIAIECDGHEWHEKTKEQAARDKARDRYLSMHFGRVIHFTGSEIYRDPLTCWNDTAKVFGSLRVKRK